jgi:hypothetical protein
MDYIIQDSRTEAENCPKGFVVNLSLGIETSPLNPVSVQIGESLQTGVTHLIDEGIFAAISAGNGNRDAKDTSPANTPRACTVGNLDIDNKIWRGMNEWNDGASNYGSTVKIWAPGAHIISTYPFQKPSPGMDGNPDLVVFSNYSVSLLDFRARNKPLTSCSRHRCLALRWQHRTWPGSPLISLA